MKFLKSLWAILFLIGSLQAAEENKSPDTTPLDNAPLARKVASHSAVPDIINLAKVSRGTRAALAGSKLYKIIQTIGPIDFEHRLKMGDLKKIMAELSPADAAYIKGVYYASMPQDPVEGWKAFGEAAKLGSTRIFSKKISPRKPSEISNAKIAEIYQKNLSREDWGKAINGLEAELKITVDQQPWLNLAASEEKLGFTEDTGHAYLMRRLKLGDLNAAEVFQPKTQGQYVLRELVLMLPSYHDLLATQTTPVAVSSESSGVDEID